MEQETKVWIVLGAVLGLLVTMGVALVVLCCWRRNRKRVRKFSLRAPTPLDDAEFESWRRPSQYAQRPEKYGIRPISSTRPKDKYETEMLQKELQAYVIPRTPSPVDAHPMAKETMSPIRKPERVRRKSSVASSLADRPPTPYSPTAPSPDYHRGSISSHTSQPLIHYPSLSEASAFRFGFQNDYSTHNRRPPGWI